MKVLIVSDTHGNSDNLEKVLELEEPIGAMIHCGDVEGEEEYFQAAIDAPCYIVAGNNDFYSDLPTEENLIFGGKRFLVTHGHYYEVSWGLERILNVGKMRNVNVVCFGHSHVPVMEEIDGIYLINPGSLTYPRQRGRKPSYIIMEVDCMGNLSFEIRYLDRTY